MQEKYSSYPNPKGSGNLKTHPCIRQKDRRGNVLGEGKGKRSSCTQDTNNVSVRQGQVGSVLGSRGGRELEPATALGKSAATQRN